MVPDSRDAPSPQVGWGVYKEEHPDQFRTPVKEENNFDWNEGEVEHYRGRGGRERGGRFPRRNQEWDKRGGGRGGRGVWSHDNKWKNGRSGPNGNTLPFMANTGPQMRNFPFLGPAGLPDWSSASPEDIRKKVIPMMVRMGEEGKRDGKLNDVEFRNFMEQVRLEFLYTESHMKSLPKVALLNETSLTREQEMRMMKSQEDKENRRQLGGERNWRPEPGSARPHLLPPPMLEAEAGGVVQGRSPHKNDLPMADAQLLELIDGDPTRSLNIDDIPR